MRHAGAGRAKASSAATERALSAEGREDEVLQRAAMVGRRSEGMCAPHPAYGVVLADREGRMVAEAHQHSEGGRRPEEAAAEGAGGGVSGGTAYVSLEPPAGEGAGGEEAVRGLIGAGVARVVVGVKSPVPEFRGKGVRELKGAGLAVDVAEEGEGGFREDGSGVAACREANESLIHREASGVPFSVHKFASTADGKIATDEGHAAWVTGEPARHEVHLERARSDAIIVGSGTVRADNPRLTARAGSGAHRPLRVVLSRNLSLPEDARLWDTSDANTLVVTQRGAREHRQRELSRRGVEVLELDFVTPRRVAEHLRERGFLRCLWECGGTLAAEALRDGVLHKSRAFIAPKIVGGGAAAPTPFGPLGLAEMTQAVSLIDPRWERFGDDAALTGYLPASGGLPNAARRAARRSARAWSQEIAFYKAWDAFGALSNFSPHPVCDEAGEEWMTAEHLYQARKFDESAPEGAGVVNLIRRAGSPSEAARLGRRYERQGLARRGWDNPATKAEAMRWVLRLKFSQHPGPRCLLLSTGSRRIRESCPHDPLWGEDEAGNGRNLLGHLLMEVRAHLRQEHRSNGGGREEPLFPTRFMNED